MSLEALILAVVVTLFIGVSSGIWGAFRELLGKRVASYQPLHNSKHTVPTEPSSSQRAWDTGTNRIVDYDGPLSYAEAKADEEDTEFLRVARKEAARNAEALHRLAISEEWWIGGSESEEEDRGAWTR